MYFLHNWLLRTDASCMSAVSCDVGTSISTTHWYLPHVDTYHTLIPTTRWYLSHIDTYHALIPTTRWYLPHVDIYHTLIPITHWYLPRVDTYHTLIPTTRWYLPHVDTYHTLIPTTHKDHILHAHISLTDTVPPLEHVYIQGFCFLISVLVSVIVCYCFHDVLS